VRKFWLVQPWVIVTICLAIMIALSVPGFCWICIAASEPNHAPLIARFRDAAEAE
jgi:hypothetical protein